jgi:rod shape-determining protein MreB
VVITFYVKLTLSITILLIKFNLIMFIKRIGIDLGTSFTRVAVEGKGLLFSEPTVVAISTKEKKVLAIGLSAKEMLGKVPNGIEARRPIRQGVIASYKLTESILTDLLNRTLGRFRIFKPEVVIGVPAGITSVEERAVIEALVQAGAGKVYLLPAPVAAAIGAKMPINTSAGNMIVNIGGGTSEIAVISMNGIVTFESKRVAGDTINDAIVNHLKKRFGIMIGEQMAEKIKIQIGSATLMDEPLAMEIRGRDGASGMPISIQINSNDVSEPIKSVLNTIINSIKKVLEITPPELSSDIVDRGMVLSGGTSMLRNIDDLFTKATGVPAHVVEDTDNIVILGIASTLDDIEEFRRSLKDY